MLTIGKLSEAAGVKVPTIRYYEEIGLLPEAERSTGNQRLYSMPPATVWPSSDTPAILVFRWRRSAICWGCRTVPTSPVLRWTASRKCSLLQWKGGLRG